MATPWSTVSGGEPSLLEKMKAKTEAEAAFKSKLAIAEQKFFEKYGVTPRNYILRAKLAAYDKTSKDKGYQGRSADGVWHTDKLPDGKERKGAIKAYHDLEEAGKALAAKGDIKGAIEAYDKAAAIREKYEEDTGKTADAGHTGAVKMLRERSNSLSNLKQRLDDKDPDVVSAKVLVKNFFQAEGIVYTV